MLDAIGGKSHVEKIEETLLKLKLLEKCLMLALLHGLAAWGMILD